MRPLLITIFLQLFFCYGQPVALVYGNHSNVCISDTLNSDEMESLSQVNPNDVLFIFSSAGNGLSSKQIDTLVSFVENGGGLYIGAENWPLQTESNQLTQRLFNKSSFGNYTAENAERASHGNLMFDEIDTIPSGKTAVAFPLDHRLTVEAWVEDQPLLLSGYLKKGRIIIDGGYSRFYCDQLTEEGKTVLIQIFKFLSGS